MIRSRRVVPTAADDLARWLRRPETDFRGLAPLATWDRHLIRFLPYAFAISAGIGIRGYIIAPWGIGIDAPLYAAAARAWLAGGDPWSVASSGIHFGAPPPTLLAFVPFILLPDSLVAAIWIVGSFTLAYLAIRALGLKWWWICFWPIVDGALVGNPDVAVLALLVIARQRLAWFAPILKIYAVFPMISMWRWKAIAGTAAVLILSAPLLPWSLWLGSLPSISGRLESFAHTTSVAGDIPLMIIGIVALLALGFRRAGWLVVPVLWPWTQPHYLAMSVPVLTPTLAILWSIPGPPPLVMLASVVVAAVGYRLFPQRQIPSDPDLRDPLVVGPDGREPSDFTSALVTTTTGSH
ncbi:MAG: hypothetical protein ABI562_08720 [Chloroflexota bacterium]